MILLIEYYKSKNDLRNAEYLYCIRRNLENKHIDKIIIFIDDNSKLDIISDKIQIERVEFRYNFSDFFNYCNLNLNDKKVILANTDIFFDNSISHIKPFDLSGKIVILNRWEFNRFDSILTFPYNDCSQDTWIFNGDINIPNTDFRLGTLGCDNRLAYLAHMYGLSIRNPSLKIRTYHVHDSNYRTYDENQREIAKYLFVLPNYDIYQPSIVSEDRLSLIN